VGIGEPCLLAVVKEGCRACEDTLPLLGLALPRAIPGQQVALVLAQEGDATTRSLQNALAPGLRFVADQVPHPLSRALAVQATPTLWRLDQGHLADVVQGFDPVGLARLVRDVVVARGWPLFELFPPGEPLPPFRPG
jgi:hypothetical protein